MTIGWLLVKGHVKASVILEETRTLTRPVGDSRICRRGRILTVAKGLCNRAEINYTMSTLQSDEETLEQLASLPSFYHQTVSPDGSKVAYYYDGTGRNELYVQDIESGERVQWSDGNVPRNARWHIKWGGPDELFFHLDEDGNEQNDIHVINAEGEARPIIQMDGQIALEDVTMDGNRLLVSSSRDGQMNLYVHDRPAEKTAKVTEYERAAGSASFSPDGDKIAFSTNETDTYENTDAYLADADGSNPENLDLGKIGAETAPVEFSPAGGRLLISDNSNDLGRFGVYDCDTSEVTWYESDAPESPEGFLPDGERVLVTRQRQMATINIVYELKTGNSTEFDLPVGTTGTSTSGNPVINNDRVVISHTTHSTRPDMLAYDLQTDTSETLHAADYGPFSPQMFSDAEFLSFESDAVPETPARAVEVGPYDTLEIEALLYDSGERPAPLVVKIHGGPRAADYRRFDLFTQFLISQGYSVLLINYRGSTGRGRTFAREIYDDWGGAEQGDIATGVEHVLSEYNWVDEDRIAIFGGSYGGYTAYWQAVQYPDLYAASIAWIGLTDLTEMFETTMPHFRTELMEKNIGTPEANPELYRERSPIEYTQNVESPMLMIHGVNDRRVPVSQSRLFRDDLREHGYTLDERDADTDGDSAAEIEYVELGKEGHASTDASQKIRIFTVLAGFLERRL
jgi:dipeptidyl aminopeptidase/acylaminoacyl peptidase